MARRLNESQLFWLALLIFCAIKFLCHFERSIPIDPIDESTYVSLALAGKPLFFFGYGYSRFLQLLHLFVTDGERLYYFNIAFQVSLLPFLHFILLRRLSVRCSVAFFSAFFLLLAKANFLLDTWVGVFNLNYLYLALIGISFIHKERVALLVLAIVSMAGIFIRQDDIWISLGILGYWALVSRAAGPKRILAGLAGYFTAMCALFYLIGQPFTASRTWATFTDHYYSAHIYAWPAGTQGGRWPILAKVFGSSNSVAQVMWDHPGIFFGHVASNIGPFFRTLFRIATSHYAIIPWGNSDVMMGCEDIAVILGLAFLTGRKLLLLRAQGSGFRELWKELGWFQKCVLLVLLLCLFKCTVTSLLLETWVRYSFDVVCVVALGLALAYEYMLRDVPPLGVVYRRLAVLPLVVLLFLVPATQRLSDRYLEGDIVRRIGHFLRDSNLSPEAKFYSMWSYTLFMNGQVSQARCMPNDWSAANIKAYSRSDLRRMLDENHVDVVVLDRIYRMMKEYYNRSDSTEDFERNFSDYGFRKVLELDPEDRVYFRKDIPSSSP